MSVENIKVLSIHFTSITLSLTLAGFSIYKLAKNEDTSLWVGVLSAVVGIYIPSPLQLTSFFTKSSSPPSTVGQV